MANPKAFFNYTKGNLKTKTSVPDLDKPDDSRAKLRY